MLLSDIKIQNEYMRGIFNLQGTVFPAVLLDGMVIGKWKKSNSRLNLTFFKSLNASEKAAVTDKIECLWNGTIKKIIWE